jgi:mono/diheme cytochrome c family protein
MKRVLIIAGAVIACILLIGWLAFSSFSLAAVAEPGGTESYIATRAKHLLISRSVREGVPPRPLDRAASAAQGDNTFAVRCSLCHGEDGHSRTPIGQWMYPRATDLTSKEVQSYSDQELFWIVKNGIRLSGMPAFGKTETDEHIWNMVDHLRTLPVVKK